tara:strand:- start:19713 stop:20585 length:873 start_codon:yes stop_codon:yes gene_type:complete
MKANKFHNDVIPFLSCKDHLVSNETYQVMRNKKLEMLVTSPIPENLNTYYDSEDYQSHNSSRKSLLNSVYNMVKKRSFKIKYSLFNKKLKTKTLLDIGAGTGDFLTFCKSKGFTVTGVEPHPKARSQAQVNGLILKENLNELSSKKYEIITLWHVLEHVPNLNEYLEQLKILLSEKGQLFVAVPNYKSFDAGYYKEFWAAYDVPRHLWHFSQESIHMLFETVGLKVKKVYPMKFDSFYVSLLSEKNKSGKFNFLTAFFVGLLSNIKAKKTKEYSSLIYELKHAPSRLNNV